MSYTVPVSVTTGFYFFSILQENILIAVYFIKLNSLHPPLALNKFVTRYLPFKSKSEPQD